MKTFVFNLTMPNRSLSYPKIGKGEGRKSSFLEILLPNLFILFSP